MTASIGVSVYPVHGSNQRELIRQADFDMYLAKAPKVALAARIRKVAAR